MSELHAPSREEVSKTVQVMRKALRGLYRSRLPQMAAALSYRTIFGLVPTIVVGLVVLQAIASPSDIESILKRVLEYAGISQIAIDEDELIDPSDVAAQVEREEAQGSPHEEGVGAQVDQTERAGDQASMPATSSEERLDKWIQDRVTTITELKLKTVGIVGFALLVYAALSMLVEVERAFNQIYHARAGRSWSRRIVQYWAVLTLGSIVLVASFALGEVFRTKVAGLAEAGGFNYSILLTIVGFLTTVAISMLLLVFLYRVMPNTHVQLRTAFAGAFVAAVLWEAGKWGFTRYLDYSAGLQRLYGQMALLPLFLLWIYVTWLIVLFGLQVSYGLQMFSTWLEEEDEDEPALMDPMSVVSIVATVAGAFKAGKSLRADQVSEHVGVPEDLTRRMLDALAGEGVLNRVSREDSAPAYSLARPADEIAASDLVAIGQRMVSQPAHDQAGAFYEDLRTRTRQLVAGRSVASIVRPEAKHETDDVGRDHPDAGQ
jgi:membrane protein